MLSLVSPLIAVVCLALTDSICSVRQIIYQSLCCVSLLVRIPVSDDLTDVLARLYSLDCSALEQILFRGQLLPVNSISGIADVFSYNDILLRYVFDRECDPLKACSAELLRLPDFLVSLDDLHAASDDRLSGHILGQIYDHAVSELKSFIDTFLVVGAGDLNIVLAFLGIDLDGKAPLLIEVVAFGWLCLLDEVCAVAEV